MSRGIHSRGYLPHWDFSKSHQAITFRLADSVPSSAIAKWRDGLTPETQETEEQARLHRLIAKYEDAGHGDCILRLPECAELVQKSLLDGHETSYDLLAWVVMPNHVHVLIRLNEGASLSKIVQIWKGGTSLKINRLLERKGTVWEADYYDRYIRDQEHLNNAVAYIHDNPVMAGLCKEPSKWPFSSAGTGWQTERGL